LVIWPFSALAADGGSPLEIHGFVSQGAIKTTANNYLAESERGSIEFNEVGINFTKELTPDLRAGMQLFMRDLGPIGNYQPAFDWFYLDYRFWDWLGMRAGRTKIPFGLYNETNDIDAARVPILLPQSVYPTRNRDYLLAQTGFELYGTVPLGGAGDLEYRAYGGTIFIDPDSVDNETILDFSIPYMFGGRLMWQTPLEGLQAGGSIQKLRLDIDYAPPPEALMAVGIDPATFVGPAKFRLPVLLWVASLEYAADELLIAAEYSRWHVNTEGSVPQLLPAKSKVTSERAYAMASFRIAPWFTPGVYYSVLFPDVDDRSGDDLLPTMQRRGRSAYQHDLAVTLRYDVNEHWLVKLEGHYMHGTADLTSDLNDGAPPNRLTTDWGVFLAKTTAYF
jgi:hypothetical protein